MEHFPVRSRWFTEYRILPAAAFLGKVFISLTLLEQQQGFCYLVTILFAFHPPDKRITTNDPKKDLSCSKPLAYLFFSPSRCNASSWECSACSAKVVQRNGTPISVTIFVRTTVTRSKQGLKHSENDRAKFLSLWWWTVRSERSMDGWSVLHSTFSHLASPRRQYSTNKWIYNVVNGTLW